MYKEIDKNMWAVWLVGKGTVEDMAVHEYRKNDVTQEFFAKLAARGYDPLWHSITGIVECDIENEGRWFVAIQSGNVTVSKDTTRPDCVIACSKDVFEGMLQEKLNPFTSLMQEKLSVKGELGLAQIFQRLFRE